MKSYIPVRYTVAALAALTLMMSATFVSAQRGGGGRGLGPNATEEQTAAFTQLNQETADLTTKVTAARTELNNAIYAEKVDEAAIKGKVASLAKAEEELALARAKAFAKVRSKFTPEQIDIIKAPRAGGGGGGRGNRRGAAQ